MGARRGIKRGKIRHIDVMVDPSDRMWRFHAGLRVIYRETVSFGRRVLPTGKVQCNIGVPYGPAVWVPESSSREMQAFFRRAWSHSTGEEV